jgi:hypothetical protein
VERPRTLAYPKGRWIKGARWSLLKSPDKQTIGQLALGEVQQANKAMFRAFLLKEELRLLYQLQDPTLAPAHIDASPAWASRSRLKPFVVGESYSIGIVCWKTGAPPRPIVNRP